MSRAEFSEHGLVVLDRDAFPAIVDGKLAPPPPSHLLDHLVRQYVLDEEAILASPEDHELLAEDPGTAAYMYEGLPACDLCEQAGRGEREARYDGPTSSRRKPVWGYLCPDCFALRAPPLLGEGRAQYLFTKEDLSPELEAAFFRAREYWLGKGVDVLPHHPFE